MNSTRVFFNQFYWTVKQCSRKHIACHIIINYVLEQLSVHRTVTKTAKTFDLQDGILKNTTHLLAWQYLILCPENAPGSVGGAALVVFVSTPTLRLVFTLDTPVTLQTDFISCICVTWVCCRNCAKWRILLNDF